ncbi:MAG TPA: hypothetical protein VHL50_08905 [Pyrinomonadaceae bacterium]|jgi:hypothetical protein|nr:hypothetical protein [Pyrinomonadaceae bacterium]
MKHLSSTILLILIVSVAALAQSSRTDTALTAKQWDDLYSALDGENWNAAEKLSSDYLKQVKTEDVDHSLARLQYMYLYSAAGKVSEGVMSFDDLEKRIKEFVGKEVSLPYQNISANCRQGPRFNTICAGDDPARIMITASNRAATTIHAFQYIQLKQKFDFAKNDGKIGSVTGTITSIVPNPNKSPFLVMRIYISDGVIETKDHPAESSDPQFAAK